MLWQGAFFCELYKKRYNIDVISYSFPIGKISMSGFDKRRTQLCVSNNNCITITKYINRRDVDRSNNGIQKYGKKAYYDCN